MSDDSRFLPPMLESTALFSEDGRYRRFLVRVWDREKPRACVALLNPSTAGADEPDHTVTNTVRIANFNGIGGIEVVNAFELVSTDPGALKGDVDPVGPTADADLLEAMERADRRIAGWGAGGELHWRGLQVVAMLSARYDLECFGTTATGAPMHPCRISPRTRIVPYLARGEGSLHSIATPPESVPWRSWKALANLDGLARAADHASDPDRFVPRLMEREAALVSEGVMVAWRPMIGRAGEGAGGAGVCVCGRAKG